MFLRSLANLKNCTHASHNAAVTSQRSRHGASQIKRSRKESRHERTFVPPETWYEPAPHGIPGYEIVVQHPGDGYRHMLTSEEIRERLNQLPAHMLEPLQVIHLGRITRKKLSFPCYGMQWGTALYLYPVESDLVEFFSKPPQPALWNETRMYGGRWEQESANCWKLIWSEASIKDFYLNNVLIHELGHLLDRRNTRSIDRERYAEWFAIEHGYKPSRRAELAKRAAKKVVRRHHTPSSL